MGPLIEDAKFSSESFDQLLYSHTKRECNSVAHILARYAINIPNFLVYIKDVPPQFYLVLQTNLACSNPFKL